MKRTAIAAAALVLGLAPSALADGDPPAVSGLHVSATHELTFRVSEYALVHVVIHHRSDRIGRIERAFLPGAGRIAVGRIDGRVLPRGSYSATVTASDVARNWAPHQVVRFRIG